MPWIPRGGRCGVSAHRRLTAMPRLVCRNSAPPMRSGGLASSTSAHAKGKDSGSAGPAPDPEFQRHSRCGCAPFDLFLFSFPSHLLLPRSHDIIFRSRPRRVAASSFYIPLIPIASRHHGFSSYDLASPSLSLPPKADMCSRRETPYPPHRSLQDQPSHPARRHERRGRPQAGRGRHQRRRHGCPRRHQLHPPDAQGPDRRAQVAPHRQEGALWR